MSNESKIGYTASKHRSDVIQIVPNNNFRRTELIDPRYSPSEPAPWWRNAFVNQIMLRSFNDSNGDGIGDLPGLNEKAWYFSDVGYNGVWLNPINESPRTPGWHDNGYNISNFEKIASEYGTEKDFVNVVRDLENRNIKLIWDAVLHTTSDEHPWFKNSRSSIDSSLRKRYFWRKKSNNWPAAWSDSAWEPDPRTGEVYLHKFGEFQPNINLEDEGAWDYMKSMLVKRIDPTGGPKLGGARIDSADLWFVTDYKNAKRNPNYVNGVDRKKDRLLWRDKFFNPQLTYQYLGDLSDLLDAHGAVAIGEVMPDHDNLQNLYTKARMHLPLNTNFQGLLVKYRSNPQLLEQVFQQEADSYAADLPQGSAMGWGVSCHDLYDRPAMYGSSYMKALMLYMMTLGDVGGSMGFAYYGDDWGMKNGPITPENMTDISGLRQGFSRSKDKVRTPNQWDESENAGFTTGTPYLPVGDPSNGQNVEAQMADPNSLLNGIKEGNELRVSEPALANGAKVWYTTDNGSVMVNGRKTDHQELIVVSNLTEEGKTVALPHGKNEAELKYSTDFYRERRKAFNRTLQIGPHETCLIEI